MFEYVEERRIYHMSNPNTGIGGPGFVAFFVRDVTAAADFYEHKVGLKRDSLVFPGAVAFQSTPIPFALMTAAAPPAKDRDSVPTPGAGISVWFKAADGQAAYEAMREAGVTIVRPPFDGPFGRTFVFSDLDGYLITVYEQDTPILDRMPPR
jgi:predicted enzyme related to lactoylglutathione lyase